MNTINLLSLIKANVELKPETYQTILNRSGIKFKDSQIKALRQLVQEIINIKTRGTEQSNNISILDSFYIGYTIKQIGKEFDMLRIGKNIIVNIELINTETGKEIIEQHKKNRCYLDCVGKIVHSFTCISDENILLYYNDGIMQPVGLDFLISILESQVIDKTMDIDKMFEPINYLASPFNATEKFIQGEYVLTNEQETIKKRIMEPMNDKGNLYFSIYGAAGTGKTLLTYDIAIQYMKNQRVVIFHCGQLNEGQEVLIREHGWNIVPINALMNLIESNRLKEYDLIIIDEVQRIEYSLLKELVHYTHKYKKKCIFAYDGNQCLKKLEIYNNIPRLIDELVQGNKYNLTENIRTNKEISTFIMNLFEHKTISSFTNYKNIELSYFTKNEEVLEHVSSLADDGWKAINYTPISIEEIQNEQIPYEEYQDEKNDNSHSVIGQEFDKVVVILDSFFFYNNTNKLTYCGSEHYHTTKMLYQNLTRARKKLHVVILNNEEMMNSCVGILGG